MDRIIKILKDFESLDLDGRSYIKQNKYRALANALKESINHLPEYEDLNDHLKTEDFYSKSPHLRIAYELGARNTYYFMKEEKYKNS